MRNLLKISACWLLTLTGLAGCGVEVYTGGEEGDVPLTFAGGAESHTLTRGTMAGNTPWTTWPYYTSETDRSKMTVNGVYYVDAMTPLGQQFMYDQEVAYNPPVSPATQGTWSYTPIKYWPNVGYLDLYALTPSLDQLAAELTTPEKGSGIRNLTYYHQPKDGVLISFDYSTRKPGGTPPEVSDLAKPDEGHLKEGADNIPVSPAKIDANFTGDLQSYEKHASFNAYDDARHQPDLMLAYHPHLVKPAVGTKVAMNFTHSLMAVRFWLKGKDDRDDETSNVPNINTLKSCAFKQISDFRLESVSLGNVYYSGHCDAYDKTDWAAYGTATNGDLFKYDSSTPVLLTYRWSFDNDADPREWFTQKTDFSLRERYFTDQNPIPDALKEKFPQKKENKWWALPKSVPLIPDFRAPNEGYSSGQIEGHTGVGAFLLPPQALQGNHQDLRVSFTMTDDDGTTLTQTLESKMPMTDEEANTTGLVIGPGQVLDIYLTFHLDGDDYFKFQIDAQISNWNDVAGYTTDLITDW